jgi:hypothetical protein
MKLPSRSTRGLLVQRMSALVSAASEGATETAAGAAVAAEGPKLRNYVDVHCHIIHEQFAGEEDAVSSAPGILVSQVPCLSLAPW